MIFNNKTDTGNSPWKQTERGLELEYERIKKKPDYCFCGGKIIKIKGEHYEVETCDKCGKGSGSSI